MVGWASAAGAAVALALGAAQAGTGGGARGPGASVCELRGADRARTSSLHCIACHSGGGGPPVDFHMGAGDGETMSHPVEVDYREVAAREPDRYVAAELLPREVPLVDGRVACTSCHDGASPDPKHVATVSRLCETCHRL